METGFAEIVMQCFGGFRLDVDGKEIHNFSTDKTRALLIYLVIESPRSFRRSHLAGLFWSDFSEEQALHSLRQTLVWLKKAIPRKADQPPLWITKQDSIAINPEVDLWVDLKAFDIAYQRTLKNFSSDQNLDCINIIELQKAVSLFKGSFLERFSLSASPLFDEWVLTIQESSSQKAAHLMHLLCEYYERRADYINASALADRIILLTPWDETAYMHSMHLYALRKHWGTAAKRYFQLKKYLNESFSIEPEAAVTDLYKNIRQASLTSTLIQPAVIPVQSSRPEHAASFWGRKKEISALVSMLSDPKIRMITLLGMGGIGKSRLAIEIGHLLHGLYNDGVFFIPLREVTSSEGLIHQFAEILNFRFSSSTPHDQQILNFLREKRMLLILDCFEHLLTYHSALNFLSDLLFQAPGVKLMVTSRDHLNLQEEHIFQLGGLDFCAGESIEPQECEIRDSVALFVDRANQVNHPFFLDPQTEPLVSRCCRLLEGHPLSIELIAASARRDNLSDLLSNLEIDLLSIHSPLVNGAPEHSSLSIVMEKSWNALNQHEQETLTRLAAFKSSFSIEAYLEVSQSPRSVLSCLVNKCWIQTSDSDRCYFHEIIRQFVRVITIESKNFRDSQAQHATYFISRLNEINNATSSSFTENLLDRMETDLQNYTDAWHYYLENAEFMTLVLVLEPLYQFFKIRSRFQEGINLFQEAFQSCSNTHLRIKLAIRIGNLAHRLRQNELTYQMFSFAIKELANTPDNDEAGLAHIGLGDYYLRQKNYELALQNAQKGIEYSQASEDIAKQASAHKLLGLIHNRLAQFPLAKQALTQSIALSRKINDRRGMISSLNILGDLACNDGDYSAAEAYFLESLSYSQSFKDLYNQAILLNNLASVYRPQKDYEAEESVLIESLAICRKIGDRDGEAIALNNLGDLAIVRKNYEQAIDFCRQSLEIALELGESWTIIINYDILGEAYSGLKQPEKAMHNFVEAAKLAYQVQSWDLLTRVIVNTAGILTNQGEVEKAKYFLTAALSHPGILYEFKIKALNTLEEMGFEPPSGTNPDLMSKLMHEYFDTSPAE
ncbi:MAG TPA: tetratricopeptide repeat protein [Brevefilum sp.]